MYESVIEKVYYVVHNTVTNPILWIAVLYLIIFIILTLLKFWEGIFDEGVSYIKNIIYFIYLPVLLLCCIMGFFSDIVINMERKV